MRLLKYFLVLAFVALNLVLTAQNAPPGRRGSRIIDDTSRQIYGPNTSKYYYEQDVFYNRPVVHPIDTVIRNFHRYNYVQRYNNLYQDLGNIGTAIRPIFYQSPEVIGARSGHNVYDLYWDTEQIRYFDTKSPYSNMNVILGGKNRSLTRAMFTRNINPRWNFGFDYHGLFIDKQIQRAGKGDRITRSNYYDFFTSFATKDSTYRLFANARRMFHRVKEFGGVRVDSTDNIDDMVEYFDPNAKMSLTAAESNDLRSNFHLYHQYQIGKALQLYHVADRYRQKNNFLDRPSTDQGFFTGHFVNYITSNDSIRDVAKFKVVRNEVGIKGNLAKLFYNGYYAIRHYKMYNNYLPEESLQVSNKGNESYLGGRMELRLDSLGSVNGWAEVNQDGNYRIEGSITSKWFEASARQLEYKPSFAQQAYSGAYNFWNNSFGNIQATQLNGYLHYRSRVLNVSPGLTFTRLHNYVFFKSEGSRSDASWQVSPVQSSGDQIITSPELRFSITVLRHITWTNQVIYTKLLKNADEAIRIPEIFLNTQLSYANIFFHGNFDMHAGIDIHRRSNYYPLAYDPAVRQFYTQDTFLAKAFPIADLFLNAKILRGRIFFKWNNIMQIITKQGYFPTPDYPGQRNIIDFGFDWSFYD